MNIGHAFAIAWQDLKKGATAAQAFLTTHGGEIRSVVKTGESIVVAIDPQAAPLVTVFDNLEEAAIGQIAAALSQITTAPDAATFAVNFPSTMWPALKQLASTLGGHPAVVAATPQKS